MAELKEQLKASIEAIDSPKKKLPTVQIQGKDYTLVKDRILYFNETFPNGMIITEILSDLHEDRFLIRATVYPDGFVQSRRFVGHSQAIVGDGYINKTSALENAETSAVGRALAMMGIGVIESIASGDEIHKAKSQEQVIEAGKLKAAEMKAQLAQEQGIFHLDGQILTCIVKGIQKKTTTGAKKAPFLSVTFNGRLPDGASFASCFDDGLWEALEACLDKQCKLELTKGKFYNITDVLEIAGVGHNEETDTPDDDIPF
jgi:hypothetical protein